MTILSVESLAIEISKPIAMIVLYHHGLERLYLSFIALNPTFKSQCSSSPYSTPADQLVSLVSSLYLFQPCLFGDYVHKSRYRCAIPPTGELSITEVGWVQRVLENSEIICNVSNTKVRGSLAQSERELEGRVHPE